MDFVTVSRSFSSSSPVSRSSSPVSLSESLYSRDSFDLSRCHSPLSRVDIPSALVHPVVAELRGQPSGYRTRPRSDGDVWSGYLTDVDFSPHRNITDHSCLKVYHKDPAQAFSHGARPSNGDARVSAMLVWTFLLDQWEVRILNRDMFLWMVG